MMRKYKCFLLFLVLMSNHALAQIKLSKSDMVIVDFKRLAENKKKLLAKDPAYLPAYNSLLTTANELLQYKPVTVMQKTDTPPSGDKHDYMSLAPYWWPNPATKDGLPYIRKDGEINPEVKNYPDKEQMPTLCENVNTLALAYYFSDDEKYANHACKLVRVWFLNEATKMNPNLKYGQAVKGVTQGRAEGLIDTRQFIYALDGIAIIKKSKSWLAQDQSAMQHWISDFLNWINTSPIGNDETNALNNHGVWLDAQTLALAIFADSLDLAKKIVNRSLDRLDKQMNSDGLFPLELARTTSLHYSVFILNAFNVIATESERIGIDYWNRKTNSGKSLKMAYDAIIPFLEGKTPWLYKEIRPFNMSDAFPILLSARFKYNCKDCTNTIQKHAKEQYETLLLNLL